MASCHIPCKMLYNTDHFGKINKAFCRGGRFSGVEIHAMQRLQRKNRHVDRKAEEISPRARARIEAGDYGWQG